MTTLLAAQNAVEGALLVTRVLRAAAVAGANMMLASHEVSAMLERKRLAGDATLSLGELLAYMDQGDAKERDIKAKIQAAIAAGNGG